MAVALKTRYDIGNFIDTFALGHYARVLDALDHQAGRPVAFKVMRPEHVNPGGSPRWEAQAFPHEVRLLSMLADHPAPVAFYDCGYLSAEDEYPSGGEIETMGTDIEAFFDALYEFNAAGWRPYIALEHLPRYHSLLYVMQNGQGQRRRLPTEEGIDLALQFGDLLDAAHRQGIAYLDHKLEHVYWDGHTLRVIDWNSSKLFEMPGALLPAIGKDLHNLCVGVLYPVFTGMAAQRGQLRPQPGDQAEVERRYSGITDLDFGAEPTLSRAIQAVLHSGARQELTSTHEFQTQLQRAAQRFGWETPDQQADPALQAARVRLREGLAKLRLAEDLTREAQELFLNAATLDGLNEDMDNELRRLMRGITAFINNRVIP